jgi:hypothetical protein
VKTSGILVAVICMFFCGAAAPLPATAQNEPPPSSFAKLTAWKTADETTFGGTIQEALEKNPNGAPPGLNLFMSGSQQALYINVGPHLKGVLRQSLTAGQVIRVTGIVRSFNGQNYLLARELQIGDQKIEVRNEHGFLTYPSATTGPRSVRPESSKIGGAR